MSDLPPTPPPVQHLRTPSSESKWFPTRNPDALTSYYVGLISILPILGLTMGPYAIWRGLRALSLLKERPEVRGGTHARVGIGCSVIGLLLNLLIVLGIVMAIATAD